MNVPYIDMHCDTLMQAWLKRKKDIYTLPKAMVDVQRLKQGGCMAQFFAIFMPPIKLKKYMGPFFPKDGPYIRKLHTIFQNTLKDHGDVLAPVFTGKDLEQNAAQGKISALLTLEDGRAVNGSLERLEEFYTMGVRLISLTWNQPNCFGSPNSDNPQVMNTGLTPFGRQAVERMTQLGMIVDVSHLSDGGFWDVAQISSKPFVASHSNCRELCPHRRNLTDDMLRALGEKGGVAGVNFGPEFLNQSPEDKNSTNERIAVHLRHMIQKGGLECAAFGSDFDGIKGSFETGSPKEMPRLISYLESHGFTWEEIEHIAYKNMQRVLKECL